MAAKSIGERALEYSCSGFNCAESTFKSLVDEIAPDASIPTRIATGFGAGMGRCGEVCGALSGAIMVLGIVYGRDSVEETNGRELAYAKARELLKAFEEEFGSVLCRGLTGCDLLTPEGRDRMARENLRSKVCAKVIKYAAEQTLNLAKE